MFGNRYLIDGAKRRQQIVLNRLRRCASGERFYPDVLPVVVTDLNDKGKNDVMN